MTKKIVALSDRELNELYSICLRFIIQNKITCPEDIYQTDKANNSLELIEDICNIVGYEDGQT